MKEHDLWGLVGWREMVLRVSTLFLPARGDRRGPVAEVRRERETVCPVESFLCWLPEIWYVHNHIHL